jgi:hypothetical protein
MKQINLLLSFNSVTQRDVLKGQLLLLLCITDFSAKNKHNIL